MIRADPEWLRSMRASEERCRALQESMRDAFVRLDMEGRILECNDLYCEMLGHAREELHALTDADLTPERWRALEAGIVRDQVLPRGCSEAYEKEYRRKDGTVFPVEARIVLLRDGDGRPEGLWAVVRDVTERRRAEEELLSAREQLRALAARVDSVREEEQRRLALELHDDLGQLLTVLSLKLDQVEDAIDELGPGERVRRLLDLAVSTTELATKARAAMRRAVRHLRPAVADAAGLEIAIRRELVDLGSCGVACELQLAGLHHALSPEIATITYRILQEALTNVVRHAEARTVQVALEACEGCLVLRVEDDGRRLHSDAPQARVGMTEMQRRALRVGGEVAVQARPEGGTCVLARIPLDGSTG